MLDSLRRQIARLIAPRAPARTGTRMYGAARQSRLTADFYAPNNSADTELASSLTMLRSRSRALIRDAGYAKKAKVTIVNNVIGTGIGMQGQVVNERGRLLDEINSAIESAWCEWMRPENCHTGGRLHFHDLERQIFGQIFEAGEVLLRKHYRPFGPQGVPFALELIEPERLADDSLTPATAGRFYRMGIERDEFGRALGFWLRVIHPGERSLTTPEDRLFVVPAEQMFHLYVCDRWPQTRGEPWLHAALTKLNDMKGLSEAEIVAARAAASYMLWVETPDEAPGGDAEDESGNQLTDISPGMVQYGRPGEKPHFLAPNRPNPNLDPFMRFMLREVAGSAMVTYEAISGDYSQSNFSSSRLGQLDARDCWRAFQQFYIRAFREPLHREWLQQAALAGKVQRVPLAEYVNNKSKFEAVLFKPRGWGYIDPEKDVAATKEAVRGGLATLTDAIAEFGNGRDIEDIVTTRKRERELLKDAGIVTDTDPEFERQQQAGQTQAAAAQVDESNRQARAFEAVAVRLADQRPPEVHVAPAVVNITPAPITVDAPVVNIAPAAITVESPVVNVAPPAPPPITVEAPVINIAPQPVHVNAAPVNVTTPDVKIEFKAPDVNVSMPSPPQRSEAPATFDIVERDERGHATVIKERREAA